LRSILSLFSYSESGGTPLEKSAFSSFFFDPKKGEKKRREVLKEFWVVDETTGKFQNLAPTINYLEQKDGEKKDPYELIKEQNTAEWFRKLQGIAFHAHQGRDHVHRSLIITPEDKKSLPELQDVLKDKTLTQNYKLWLEGKTDKLVTDLGQAAGKAFNERMSGIAQADIYLRDAYSGFQSMFNEIYKTADKSGDDSTKAKLNKFKKELLPNLKKIKDPANINDFADTIVKGVNLLRSIEPIQPHKPLKDFAIDKGSDTFSSVAFKSYDKFGDKAPIISIENPPVGMGLSRAEEITDLIKASRKKFAKQLMEKKGMSEGAAKNTAEKHIGATWDIGHINMLRKYGYTTEDLIKQTEKIAPFAKHIHLSDNFGMEHTELPMGMGNVPYEQQMKILSKYNDKMKKIIETGNWYQHFQVTPFTQTLEAFNSPIYSMKMQPYWTGETGGQGAYFAGYGMNPEVHHSIYGSGFSNLPVELGGQVGGRNRLSGSPIE